MNDYQSIDALVSGMTGTIGFLSKLVSRKSGLALIFIVFSVIVSTLILR